MITGSSVYAASQWAMLIALARLGSPEIVGKFTLALAVTGPIMIFSNLGLRQLQATDALGRFQFPDYLWLRVVSSLAGWLAVWTVTGVGGYRGESAVVILLIGAAKGFENISDIFHGLAQRNEELAFVGRSRILRGLAGGAALGAGYYASRSIVVAAASVAAVSAAILVFYDYPVSRVWWQAYRSENEQKKARHWNPLNWKNLAIRTLPMGVAAALLSLESNIPRYFIEKRLGESALGIFACLAYFKAAGTIVMDAVGQAVGPRMAVFALHGEREGIRRLQNKLRIAAVGLALGGVVGAALFGKFIVHLVYGEDVGTAAASLVGIMAAVGVGFLASAEGYVMTALGLIRIQPLVFAGAAAISAIGCHYLVPRQGFEGASLAWAAGLLYQWLVGRALNRRALSALENRNRGEIRADVLSSQ